MNQISQYHIQYERELFKMNRFIWMNQISQYNIQYESKKTV